MESVLEGNTQINGSANGDDWDWGDYCPCMNNQFPALRTMWRIKIPGSVRALLILTLDEIIAVFCAALLEVRCRDEKRIFGDT
ncbi:MAG: hypothetical protein OEV21_06755 [Thermoplasmata archaeon]|nr:hypothetical protein [Thermoplasmata archaeon]